MNIKALHDISYGMYVVSTKYNDQKAGCIVNTVTQVTSENPIITVNINKNNYTNEMITNSKKLVISILSENATKELISNFGYFSSKEKDKFETIKYDEEDNLPIIKEGVCSYLICELIEKIDCGTHDIFMCKVIKTEKITEEVPMTYKYYREVLKGTSPKNAPTYEQVETNQNESKYRCSICGHIYDEAKEGVKFENLPDDWRCPICGVSKNLFEKI